MDMSTYIALTRQTGLTREIQMVANNIANVSTQGFRREGIVFSEMIEALPVEGGSVAMTAARTRYTDAMQGALVRTGNALDMAIEGEGFFQVELPDGPRLTRAGNFTTSADGELVTPDGARLLDVGGAPVLVPAGVSDIALASDGTLTADGAPVAQIGLVRLAPDSQMIREDGIRFRVDGATEPVLEGRILQGFVEQSNVSAMTEMSRMIEVQRAYEYGARFLDQEHNRLQSVIRTLGQNTN